MRARQTATAKISVMNIGLSDDVIIMYHVMHVIILPTNLLNVKEYEIER
jgi:hypothetical protein